jgi:hypothetical protein
MLDEALLGERQLPVMLMAAKPPVSERGKTERKSADARTSVALFRRVDFSGTNEIARKRQPTSAAPFQCASERQDGDQQPERNSHERPRHNRGEQQHPIFWGHCRTVPSGLSADISALHRSVLAITACIARINRGNNL